MFASAYSCTVFAHHSFAAEFDSTKCRDFTGTLTKLDWQSPHAYFYLDIKGANGKVENWSFQTYARWDGDSLVVESIGFDDRTYIMPNGWFHSDELRVTERYSRPSMNYLMVQITVDDPKVLEKPWKSAPRRWTLGNGDVYEFYCTNNKELEELQKLRDLELKGK